MSGFASLRHDATNHAEQLPDSPGSRGAGEKFACSSHCGESIRREQWPTVQKRSRYGQVQHPSHRCSCLIKLQKMCHNVPVINGGAELSRGLRIAGYSTHMFSADPRTNHNI